MGAHACKTLARAGYEPVVHDDRLFGDGYPTSDGTCVRDYIHVSDLATARLAALEKPLGGARGLRVNPGAGPGYPVRQIIDESRRVPGPVLPCSLGPRRAGDAPSLAAQAALVKEIPGWEASCFSLENIIATAWAWFLQERGNRLAWPDSEPN